MISTLILQIVGWHSLYVLGIFKDMQPRDVDQLVDRLVWDQEAPGSSPGIPTLGAVESNSEEFKG